MKTNEIKNELYDVKKWKKKKKNEIKDLKYKANKLKYDFQQCQDIFW